MKREALIFVLSILITFATLGIMGVGGILIWGSLWLVASGD